MGKKENRELLTAVAEMDLDAVEAALKSGADVNYATESPEDDGLDSDDIDVGATAILIAAEYNKKTAILELLISRGANLSARDSNNATVLISAVMSQNKRTKKH